MPSHVSSKALETSIAELQAAHVSLQQLAEATKVAGLTQREKEQALRRMVRQVRAWVLGMHGPNSSEWASVGAKLQANRKRPQPRAKVATPNAPQ